LRMGAESGQQYAPKIKWRTEGVPKRCKGIV
jgi:hypothetical protein